jgi:hypothetical protein
VISTGESLKALEHLAQEAGASCGPDGHSGPRERLPTERTYLS